MHSRREATSRLAAGTSSTSADAVTTGEPTRRRRHRAAAAAAVVTLGSAGLVGVGVAPARAATADQQCAAAGGTSVTLAQGWLTQCTLTKGAHTWTAPSDTRATIFDVSGAQGGTTSSGGIGGYGGEARGMLAATSPGGTGTLQINVGGQDGSSGTSTVYNGAGTPDQPFAGGAGETFSSGNGGGATAVYISSPSQPLIVGGGGGGTGSSGSVESGHEGFVVGGPANGGNGGFTTADGQMGPNIASCAAGSCQVAVQAGGGGYGGSHGGGGGSDPLGGAPAQAGSNITNGGNGEGGANSWGGGGGGGGFAGGGAGNSGYTSGTLGWSGGGGGGGGQSYAAYSIWYPSSRDASRTGDGLAVVTTMHTVGQYDSSGFTFAKGTTFAPGAAYTTDGYELTMQTDGNLVVYNNAGAAVWGSGTYDHPGAHAVFQTDGTLAIWADQAQTQLLWSTGTAAAGGNQTAFTPDGSLLVKNSAGAVLWTSQNNLTAGMTLQPGVQLWAANGVYLFAMQGDGNLVEYNAARKPIWASNTAGHAGAFAVMQSDGNFVVYADQARQHALWATGTNGSGATNLLFQNDGNLVLYRGNGSVAWAGNTAGK